MAEKTKQEHPAWMGKNSGMSADEINEFLAGPIVARVATIDEQGLRYITPVWEEWDGQALWIVPRERSAWVQHIKHNPNVAVSCAMDSGTYKRVLFRGKAEIVSGPAPMAGKCLEVAQRMAIRYLVPTHDRPRYLIKVVPQTTVSWDGVEWHDKYTVKS